MATRCQNAIYNDSHNNKLDIMSNRLPSKKFCLKSASKKTLEQTTPKIHEKFAKPIRFFLMDDNNNLEIQVRQKESKTVFEKNSLFMLFLLSYSLFFVYCRSLIYLRKNNGQKSTWRCPWLKMTQTWNCKMIGCIILSNLNKTCIETTTSFVIKINGAYHLVYCIAKCCICIMTIYL